LQRSPLTPHARIILIKDSLTLINTIHTTANLRGNYGEILSTTKENGKSIGFSSKGFVSIFCSGKRKAFDMYTIG
jgi:hypothetical protein